MVLVRAEGVAEDDLFDEVAESVVVGGGLLEDLIDRRAIEGFHAAAAGIGEESVGEHVRELVLAFDEDGLELGDVAERLMGGEFAGRFDGHVFAVVGAPAADGIEVLQGESRWVDFAPRTSGSMAGTLSGGGEGGVPRMFSRIQTPRMTGEVSTPLAETVSTLAWPKRPPRRRSGRLMRWKL